MPREDHQADGCHYSGVRHVRVRVGPVAIPRNQPNLGADSNGARVPDVPSGDMIPSLLALSDVMGTGWFAATAANDR